MSLSQYIKTHKVLKEYDFATVYFIIIELLKDGKMEWDTNDVQLLQPEPDKKQASG